MNARSSVRAVDLLRLAGFGLRIRPLRASLAALAIAIGIASMVAVIGVSESTRAGLDRALDRLGTNLLTASAGKSLTGEDAQLPREAVAMVDRIGPVTQTSAVGRVADANVYRNDHISRERSGAIAILAARLDLLDTLGLRVGRGVWLNEATARYPVAVLGRDAADTLGVGRVGGQIWLSEQWFTVVGILEHAELTPAIDNSALVGWPVAEERLGFDGHPTLIFERSADRAVDDVRRVLARTVDPAHPEQVSVSRPSDALAARTATTRSFNGMLLGIAAVALLVGGIGVANTMIITIVERRNEIGIRRALGAARAHIAAQFLGESLLLSVLGGSGGVALGVAITAVHARSQGNPVTIPPTVLAVGLVASAVIGALAGLYPAVRAARLTPTDALASV
jgi:putative ABC transport system permease protein